MSDNLNLDGFDGGLDGVLGPCDDPVVGFDDPDFGLNDQVDLEDLSLGPVEIENEVAFLEGLPVESIFDQPDVAAVNNGLGGDSPEATDREMILEVEEDIQDWFLQTGNTCGPAAITTILEDFTGQDLHDETAVASWATENGLLSSEGMTQEAAVTTLEHFGIPSHLEQGDWSRVDDYVEDGRAVVLFVDASEYWENASVADNSYHFVRVVDVDVDSGYATLVDTGNPDGQGMRVPLSTLDEAWDESGEVADAQAEGLVRTMIVSDVADPDDVGDGQVSTGNVIPDQAEDRLPGWADRVLADQPDTGAPEAVEHEAVDGEPSVESNASDVIDPSKGFVFLPIALSAVGLRAFLARRK